MAFASLKSVCPYVTGPNCCLNETRMPLYYLYSFQSTSMQNIAQLAQSWYLLPFFSPIFFPSKVAAPQAHDRLRPKCNSVLMPVIDDAWH